MSSEEANVSRLSNDARVLMQAEVKRIVTAQESDGLEWIPVDFAVRVTKLAWSHQFDVDHAAFRRAFKLYLHEISGGH